MCPRCHFDCVLGLRPKVTPSQRDSVGQDPGFGVGIGGFDQPSHQPLYTSPPQQQYHHHQQPPQPMDPSWAHPAPVELSNGSNAYLPDQPRFEQEPRQEPRQEPKQEPRQESRQEPRQQSEPRQQGWGPAPITPRTAVTDPTASGATPTEPPAAKAPSAPPATKPPPVMVNFAIETLLVNCCKLLNSEFQNQSPTPLLMPGVQTHST